MDEKRKLIAVATRVGDLYYLNCRSGFQKSADKSSEQRRMSGIGVLATESAYVGQV